MTPYVFADDLSGALEAGAAFRAQGWRVTLPLRGEPDPPFGAGELRVISAETRSLPPRQAGSIVKRLLTVWESAGARLLFKKIDSTLRGPLGAELTAIMAELAPSLVVLCPAHPAAGRTVCGGELRVQGVPLAATDFRHDPLWPASDSRVQSILAGHGLPPPGYLTLEELRGDPLQALHRSAARHGPLLIADAETDADLSTLVQAVRRLPMKTILVGSGAMARVLARELGPPGGAEPPPEFPRLQSLLVLCGSAHPTSGRQLDYLERELGVVVVPFEIGETDAGAALASTKTALASRRIAAVRFFGGGRRSTDTARRVMDALRGFAEALRIDGLPHALFLTGGETAWTVCGALDGIALEVLAETEPGVVISRLSRASRCSTLVITKPGGFGDERTLERILPLVK